MKPTDDMISKVASIMGKKGWKAKLKKYGLKKIREHMREVGKKATGRPRLPDGEVKPNTLYQRARREKLKAAAKKKKGGR